jgi:ATPase subunit of ABC transporter with duplicated ATPase domains
MPHGDARTLLAKFDLYGEHVARPAEKLSPGERTRAELALQAARSAGCLVLDEPTNHLDLATKEMLIECLKDFEGTMLFVSHDRHFLAALSNRVLELTPEGVHRYDGGYTEYVARTGQEAPGLHPGG